MKTHLLFLILSFSSAALAQQRCENIFSTAEPIVDQLASLRVDAENQKDASLRRALFKDFNRKLEQAKKSQINLNSLSEKITQARDGKNQIKTEEENRRAHIEKGEEAILPTYKKTATLDTPNYKNPELALSPGDNFFTIVETLSLHPTAHFLYSLETPGIKEPIKEKFRSPPKVTKDGKYLYGTLENDKGNVQYFKFVPRQGDPLRMFTGPNPWNTYTFAISPDERFVAATGKDRLGDVILWDAKTQKVLHTFPLRQSNVTNLDNARIQFSGDGSRMLVAYYRDPVTVWDTNTFSKIAEIKVPGPAIADAQISLNGKSVFIHNRVHSRDAGAYQIWDLETETLTPIPSNPNYKVKWSVGGKYAIAFAFKDASEIVIIDLKHGVPISFIRNLEAKIKDATITADGNTIVIITDDEKTHIWQREASQ